MSLTAAALYALVGVQGAGQSVRDLQSVSNQINKTQTVMGGLSKNAGQIGKGIGQVGAGMLRIGETIALAGLAAAGASAKVGTTFEQMTELIHTQAGASQEEVDKMRVGIQNLVHDVGTGPDELAKALYHIESVGVRGGAALDILKASAIGAKVGLADMESVTNALTAVWFSGIKGAKSMTDAMAILDGIVGVGNMHLQDLTDSFKSGILGTSATYGVDIRSLGAAIATLTDAGVPADIAATRLNNTLTHLAAPVKGAISVLQKLGMGQFTLANDLHKPDGLFVALKDLHDHLAAAGEIKNGMLTPQGAADMSKLFGGSRFGATAMQLLTQMDRIEQKYTLITERSTTFGGNVAKTMETAGFKFGQFKADIEESALAFSQGFLPALARAGSRLDHFVLGHHSDIVRLGKDLGTWIDHIDWNSVEKGANSFFDVMKQVLDVVGKIPPQIDLAIIGFLGLNKVSGGLLGKGLENIAGGALGALGTLGKAGLRGALSKIPVIGGAAAALTSTPVYITGVAPGVMLGGLGGPGAIAASGGWATVGKLIGGAFAVVAAAEIADLIHGAISPGGGLQGRTETGTLLPTDSLMWPFGPKGTPHLDLGPLKDVLGGDSTFTPRTDAPANGLGATGSISPIPAFMKFLGSQGLLGAVDKASAQAELDARRVEAAENRTGQSISKAVSDLGRVHLPKSLHGLISGIEKRSMDKYHWKSGKPPESWVMGTFGRDLIGYERRVLQSHQSAAAKLSDLKHLQGIAVAGKDWGVARKFKVDIAHLQDQIRRQKIHADLTARVNLKVDGQDLANAVVKTRQFGRWID